MLKKENSKEILSGVRLKNISIEETQKLMKQVAKIAKDENGEINYDHPKAIYILFKKLIETDIKEIKNISEDDFMEAYYNPTQEMETICFEIGRFMSDCIIRSMRENISQLMSAEMQLLQAEAMTKLQSITESAKEIKKVEKKSKKSKKE